jgi:hypothetical protein
MVPAVSRGGFAAVSGGFAAIVAPAVSRGGFAAVSGGFAAM